MDDLDEPGSCPVCGAPGSSCRDVMNASGGLRIVRLGEVEAVPMVRIDRKLWKAADGSLVEDGDPRAAFLFATPGDEIPESVAEKLGLVPKAVVAVKATAKSGRKHRESVEEAAEDAEKE